MQRTSEQTPGSQPQPSPGTDAARAAGSTGAAGAGFTVSPSAGNSPTALPPQPRPERWWDGRAWWLVPVLLLLGFGFLLWQVSTHGPVTRLDLRLRDDIQSRALDPSMSWLLRPARGMADLGDQSVALSVLFLATVVALRATRSWLPGLVAAAALAALATVIPLKLWIDRPGPAKAVLGDAALGFFPSGHTADAVLCYGTSALLLCVFVLPNAPGAAGRYSGVLRRAIPACAAALVLLTIFGLLWSNFHWLSDTVGSLCWCGAMLLVLRRVTVRRVMPAIRAREQGEGNSAPPPLA